jgi:cobaltochelatase CobS
MARNNAYLYGGAGTGKTFIAEALGDMLGWEVITINCNQFTSPLDILGGQTIDGYQEGKLIMAWNNEIVNPDGSRRPINGAVLLLDELPKIDPNTAGILNDALAKVKSFKKKDGVLVAPTIRNGRNEVKELKNLFVIATGNVPLNTIDPDYEANFKQDLSLQDRFIGSTYEIFVNYRSEWETVGKGFTFIWLFLVKVREKIKEVRATNQAFVSLRLMINVRATYEAYRDVIDKIGKQRGKISNQAITQPKTVIEAMDNFFGLFKEAPRRAITEGVDYAAFKRVVEQKNQMPYNPDAPNFDTPEEIREAQELIRLNEEEIRRRYS